MSRYDCLQPIGLTHETGLLTRCLCLGECTASGSAKFVIFGLTSRWAAKRRARVRQTPDASWLQYFLEASFSNEAETLPGLAALLNSYRHDDITR